MLIMMAVWDDAMKRLAAELIGTQLKRAREDQGLSVAEAARLLKITRPTLYNYEKGRWLPKMSVLVEAATAWNASFNIRGCKVVPEELNRRPARQPQPTQLELAFQKPRLYNRATVRIRRRNQDLIITAVLPAAVRA